MSQFLLKRKYFFSFSFQITKLNVKLLNEVDCVQHYPTSTVTDLLINSEQVTTSSTSAGNGNSSKISPEVKQEQRGVGIGQGEIPALLLDINDCPSLGPSLIC